ncbi:MAG: hypothetical protein GX033_07045 [Firmicutes bacterium]|nr:hypothetical protein [Bacillota bacterium]
MQIIVSGHAKRRLRSPRQAGITMHDLRAAASSLPGQITVATRFRNFRGQSGRRFDLVVKDFAQRRLIITVIGR